MTTINSTLGTLAYALVPISTLNVGDMVATGNGIYQITSMDYTRSPGTVSGKLWNLGTKLIGVVDGTYVADPISRITGSDTAKMTQVY